MSMLDQLPRLSAYDPGAVGEGGLDPLGLGAVADRIANVLVPGLRARMSQPRFVTISAVGAIACQSLRGLTTDEGKTTTDIAFEWLVVEAMVRHPGKGRTDGLPGNQKAARARATNQRLSRRTYLNGPRVFGFTGVYRPFSRDVGVLTSDDLPAKNAARLAEAWERDFSLPGFVDNVPGSPGAQLRREISDVCRRSLEEAECVAPLNGHLLRNLSDYLAPTESRAHERRALRELITTGEHSIRNELCEILAADPPLENVTQRELALRLLSRSGLQTKRALQAAIDYEQAATALDYTFRQFLAFTSQQHGSLISRSRAQQTPGLAELALSIADLVQRAIDSVAQLDDVGLHNDTTHSLRLFANRLTATEFLDALIERHEEVQANKKKLSWLDQLGGDWTVRTPYRQQSGDLDGDVWAHPMRLVTLANFLAKTA